MLSKNRCLSVLSALGASLMLTTIVQADMPINDYELVGTWKADNCATCYLEVTMYNGTLYGDMDPWGGFYNPSYSQGPQPIYTYAGGDEFMYRGDTFHIDRMGYSLVMVNDFAAENDNVGRAMKLDSRPAGLRGVYFNPRINHYPIRLARPIDRHTRRAWRRYPGPRGITTRPVVVNPSRRVVIPQNRPVVVNPRRTQVRVNAPGNDRRGHDHHGRNDHSGNNGSSQNDHHGNNGPGRSGGRSHH
jgi:hypothetical protein